MIQSFNANLTAPINPFNSDVQEIALNHDLGRAGASMTQDAILGAKPSTLEM